MKVSDWRSSLAIWSRNLRQEFRVFGPAPQKPAKRRGPYSLCHAEATKAPPASASGLLRLIKVLRAGKGAGADLRCVVRHSRLDVPPQGAEFLDEFRHPIAQAEHVFQHQN